MLHNNSSNLSIWIAVFNAPAIALMYLQRACKSGGPAGLNLHNALQQQLGKLAVADGKGQATDLVEFLQAMDDVDGLSWLCERDTK